MRVGALKAVLLGTAVMGGVYSNWFCMMVFARVIGGYVRMTRLCNIGTEYSGTVGMYYHDKFGICVGLREYEYISGWIEGWCEDVGGGRVCVGGLVVDHGQINAS